MKPKAGSWLRRLEPRADSSPATRSSLSMTRSAARTPRGRPKVNRSATRTRPIRRTFIALLHGLCGSGASNTPYGTVSSTGALLITLKSVDGAAGKSAVETSVPAAVIRLIRIAPFATLLVAKSD